MPDRVVCLGCGGSVPEPHRELGPDEQRCTCAGSSAAPEAAEVTCASCGGSLQVGARACPYCRCTLATSRCGHCSAWNLASALHCHACGRSLSGAARGAERAAGGPCPRCGAVLYPRLYAELDVDECDKCGGLFVEAEMMQKIIAQRTMASAHGLHLALPERARAREVDVRYLRCPACQKHMNRQVFARVSGVIVDVCKVHGVWFDAGELAASLSFIERGGMAKAHRRELDQLIDERRALRSAERGAGGGPFSTNPPAEQATAWGDFTAGLIELWL